MSSKPVPYAMGKLSMPDIVVRSSIANWIYVTGVIRSGTTFVGDVLSRGLSVDYIHEPFLGGYIVPGGQPLFPMYVDPSDIESARARACDEALRALLEYRVRIPSASYDGDPLARKMVKRIVGSRGPFYLRLAKANPFSRTAVIKDPYGKVAAERLYTRFGVKPVIVVKHPVSLAASLARVQWWPELADFRDDEVLRSRFFPDDNAFFARTWKTRMHEAMAHWRAAYKILLDQADTHGDWSVVVHERLSANPVSEFRRLFERVGISFSSSTERAIVSMTSHDSTSARDGRVQDFKRDSSRIFEQRRDSVPAEQRREIFEIVEDVALRIYDRASFAID